ncbi:MAG: cryptochrome/photolyase family protein [Gammaproteobacteria bacterium]|nr:cryptochrome/photolyase family protein [Gammaproteobacteria bacterium]
MSRTDFNPETRPRHLVLILGDQLDHRAAVFDDFDPEVDALWMAESAQEATHVWCHKRRLAFFFAAMRHFRDAQRERGRKVQYHALGRRPSDDRGNGFAEILTKDVHRLHPDKLVLTHPGDLRVLRIIEDTAEALGLTLEVRADRHFLVTPDAFRDWAEGKGHLVMEHFYRAQRRRTGLLMRPDGKPQGGSWNFDKDNRKTFGRAGPGELPPPRRFRPDETTRAVLDMVAARFANHPGSLDDFDLPVTHDEALTTLRDFVTHRLPCFGAYEDAMWSGQSTLYHSRLSAVLNVKLLHPKDCLDKVIAAYEAGRAPINSVEGFVRQVLGWREFIRGIYWLHMPAYAQRNALGCDDRDVPTFYWDGETDMACVADCMAGLKRDAWTHHIPRLMVLGQFSMLLGVHPSRFHAWHMAMYLDAVDWVSLPNALGMSQHGDGGVVGSKPYCASGNYIDRMSNYCGKCRYNPKRATGADACPFTTLYWDFLDRHHDRFANHGRMKFQLKNLGRKSREELREIRQRADHIRRCIDGGERL